MGDSAADQALLAIVSLPPPAAISEVVARLQSLEAALPSTDGLKWFNRLYLLVTQEVDTQPPAGGWQDAAWLTRLDVVFAQYYFAAVQAWIQGGTGVPLAWQVLFKERFNPGVERIQFAVAGINAHINHDLALALLRTAADTGSVPAKNGPQDADFQTINGMLETALPAALQFLAAGILGEVAQDSGKVGALLALLGVRTARDIAWEFSDALRPLKGLEATLALAAQDESTGELGRALLA